MGRVASKPSWLKVSIPGGKEYSLIKKSVQGRGLHTVCAEARCPNIGECFSCGTATFMIMGSICSRNCRYCAVEQGIPEELNLEEPVNIAKAIKELKLTYSVITSVTRDDLPDGGADFYVETIRQIRKLNPQCSIEVLIPDFKDHWQSSVDKIIEIKPKVINHNIEVVKNLYNNLRPMGDYDLSLKILQRVSDSQITSKSGLMIGFGESIEDIRETLQNLKSTGVESLTVGQYLKSHKNAYAVAKYYHPDEFKEIEEYALHLGFSKVKSGPLVRSSYHAGD